MKKQANSCGLEGLLRGAWCAGVAAVCMVGGVQANPLKQLHESTLVTAAQMLSQARRPEQRIEAARLEVAALNSLGRSDEALKKLDGVEADVTESQRSAELRVKVLLPLGRCDEAMPQLQAAIERRDAAARQALGAAYQPGGLLIMGAEELLAQTYCHALNRRPDAAVASLARVFDPMDPSLMHYRAAWYAALRKMGAKPVASLEVAAQNLPRQAGVHDLGLAVVTGRMALPSALVELARRRLAPSEHQDAQAEVLFFAAVAADTAQDREPILAQLDNLAAFGSTEWMLAKRLFVAL